MEYLMIIVRTVVTIVVIALIVHFANDRLVKHFEGKPHMAFRLQLIQLGGFLFAILALILFLPLDGELRGQLLSLYGIVISATIALSSTTLVGNVMAGIMLKTIKSCRPGYYITVGDHFGRVTTMDLLHTEIQTEERDLTTLPNLYVISNPLRVMRTSGTVLFVELSLGYDVSRHEIERREQGDAHRAIHAHAIARGALHLGEYPLLQIVGGDEIGGDEDEPGAKNDEGQKNK